LKFFDNGLTTFLSLRELTVNLHSVQPRRLVRIVSSFLSSRIERRWSLSCLRIPLMAQRI